MTQTKKNGHLECTCGCGRKTSASFLPGHDSKLHALVLKISRGEAKLSELPKSERTREYLGRAPWMTAALRKAVGVEKTKVAKKAA
jgi:hypothetical protein